MKLINIIPYLLITVWSGMILGISFLEAWLKFTAPGVTLQIGLSIGMKVFSMLNKIEWLFLIVVFSWIIVNIRLKTKLIIIETGILFFILLIQTFWLLPELNLRAISFINNEPLMSKSSFHHSYIIFEVIKLFLLFVMSVQLLKRFLKLKKV